MRTTDLQAAPFLHQLIKGMNMAAMEMIFDMIKFAEEKHAGQYRKGSGLEYVSHPLCGAFLLTTFKKSKVIGELICAFIGHDLFEDTDATFQEVACRFTPLVANLMWELRSDPEQIALLGKNEYLKKKMVGLSSYGLLLKLVDRLYNVLDRPKLQYVKDTLELMDHLRANRKLTGTHQAVIAEITKRCTTVLEAGTI